MPEKYSMPDMDKTLTEQEKQLLKSILMLFITMISVLTVVLLIGIVFVQTIGATMPELQAHRQWLVIGIAVISFVCRLIAKKRITQAIESAKNSQNSLSDKLTKYRSALIVYIAISELPILLSIVLSILTGDFVFQVLAAILLGYLLAVIPIKERVLRQLL